MGQACRSPASWRSGCSSILVTGGGQGVLRREAVADRGLPREYSRGSRTRPGADRSAAGAERIGGETGLVAPDVVIVAVALQEQGDVPPVARGVVRAVGRVLVADEGHH